MKIAVFGHKHVCTREGGIEVVVSELYSRIGHIADVTVYDRWELDGDYKKPDDRDLPYRIKRSPTLKMSALNATIASFMSTLQCLFGKYDIVHVHAEGPCVFLPLLKKKKIVATCHGLDWQRAKWGGFAKWYIHLGEKMMVKYADSLIVLTDDMSRYFREMYGRETDLIENGVTVEINEDTNELDRFGIEPGNYILYTGRLVPEKRIDLLINAYILSGRKEKLVIAGKLPDAPDDEIEFARQEDNIVFTDFATGALLKQLYTHAKAFVLPSDLEGQSLSLLEGMAYGIPCIVSDIPENRKTAGEFGHVFKAGDIESLTEQLRNLDAFCGTDPYEQRLYVARNHDWDTVAKKTMEVYKNVISEEAR